MNALRARAELPAAFTDGDTDMRCLADAVRGLERTGYAHHIVRLMVFGNLALLLGVRPQLVYEWFHHSFIDGYPWVMAPNALGMATFADGGAMMTKPYAASGRYIDRMSDHCGGCRYDPTRRTGDDACPFTTLYWDFLDRNRERLAGNRRMRMPYRNLERIDPDELDEIRARARALRRGL
jgi:deoxyribodipyrimidine photolyase-related protein